jgi:D-tyrosyl-tRNA(Tyr) deacylase
LRAILQRVSRAEVRVDGRATGAIGRGLVVLLAVGRGDTESHAQWMAKKIVELRLFEGQGGHFERSLLDVGGEILLISQFTLYGDARKGRRPSFSDAAQPGQAQELYELTAELMRTAGIRVGMGVFGARMQVELVNEGPVTIMLER